MQTQTSIPKLFVHSNYKRVNNETQGRVGQYWTVFLQNKFNEYNYLNKTGNNGVFLVSGDLKTDYDKRFRILKCCRETGSSTVLTA